MMFMTNQEQGINHNWIYCHREIINIGLSGVLDCEAEVFHSSHTTAFTKTSIIIIFKVHIYPFLVTF